MTAERPAGGTAVVNLMTSWVVIALVVAAVLGIVAVSLRLARRLPRATMARFVCPWVRREVVVQYLAAEGEAPIGVLSCTAFPDPNDITCGTPCAGTELGSGTAGARQALLTAGPRVTASGSSG